MPEWPHRLPWLIIHINMKHHCSPTSGLMLVVVTPLFSWQKSCGLLSIVSTRWICGHLLPLRQLLPPEAWYTGQSALAPCNSCMTPSGTCGILCAMAEGKAKGYARSLFQTNLLDNDAACIYLHTYIYAYSNIHIYECIKYVDVYMIYIYIHTCIYIYMYKYPPAPL